MSQAVVAGGVDTIALSAELSGNNRKAARALHRIAVTDARGQGFPGSVTPPGRLGERSGAKLRTFVRDCLANNPLFADLEAVNARVAHTFCGGDPIWLSRCC